MIWIFNKQSSFFLISKILFEIGYGIGTPTGSPWRDQISNAILQLQENGELQELYTKWWEKEDISTEQKCDSTDDKKKDSASELSFAQVGGVFAVLAVGLCLSFLVALLEFTWKAKTNADKKTPFSVMFRIGFRNILDNFFKQEFEDIFAKTKKKKLKSIPEEEKYPDDDEKDDDEEEEEEYGDFIENNINYRNISRSNSSANNDLGQKLYKWNNHDLLEKRKALQKAKLTSF